MIFRKLYDVCDQKAFQAATKIWNMTLGGVTISWNEVSDIANNYILWIQYRCWSTNTDAGISRSQSAVPPATKCSFTSSRSAYDLAIYMLHMGLVSAIEYEILERNWHISFCCIFHHVRILVQAVNLHAAEYPYRYRGAKKRYWVGTLLWGEVFMQELKILSSTHTKFQGIPVKKVAYVLFCSSYTLMMLLIRSIRTLQTISSKDSMILSISTVFRKTVFYAFASWAKLWQQTISHAKCHIIHIGLWHKRSLIIEGEIIVHELAIIIDPELIGDYDVIGGCCCKPSKIANRMLHVSHHKYIEPNWKDLNLIIYYDQNLECCICMRFSHSFFFSYLIFRQCPETFHLFCSSQG